MTAQLAAAESLDEVTLAASYLRVSTKEQAERDGDPEGYSIPAQREANRRKAASLGAVIPAGAEFVDRGESARSADRPQLRAMLAYLQANPQIKYVIVHKVDRLARNRMDDVEINLALKQAGVTLVSATENIDETPSGMLLHGIMSSIAEFYSRNLATEVVKGMTQKVKTGGTPGKPPLGYRNARIINADGREVRTIELDPERADLIRWAFEAYATGEWTLTGLLQELEARGLTNTPTPKYPVRPVRPSHLYMILTHPYYKGDVVYKGATYPGRHPRLVSAATWNKVQAVLAEHGPGEKQRVHRHYLKSSVYCGGCGSRLIITNARNRYGTLYPYYVCVGRHQKRTDCTRKALLVSVIEELIEDFYADVALSPDLRHDIELTLTEEFEASQRAIERKAKELVAQKQRLTNERARLLQAHYANAIPLDLLKTEQERITDKLDAIDVQLEAVQARTDRLSFNLARALDLLTDCHRAYLAADQTTRRLLNQALFEALYIEEDGVRVRLNEPFKTLVGPEVLRAAGCRSDAAPADTALDDERHADPAPDARGNVAERDWGAEYIRLIWGGRNSGSKTNKPSTHVHCVEGLKDTTLVPPAGFEPALLPPEGSALSPELRGPDGPARRSGPTRRLPAEPDRVRRTWPSWQDQPQSGGGGSGEAPRWRRYCSISRISLLCPSNIF